MEHVYIVVCNTHSKDRTCKHRGFRSNRYTFVHGHSLPPVSEVGGIGTMADWYDMAAGEQARAVGAGGAAPATVAAAVAAAGVGSIIKAQEKDRRMS